MRSKSYIILLTFYSLFIWFYTFSYSVLPTHLLSQGLTLQQLVSGQLVRFAAQLLIIPLLIFLSSRVSWLLGITCSLLYIVLSIKIFSFNQFLIASIFSGFYVTLFYVFYNIAHFRNTPKQRTGFSSSLMFVIPIIIGIITPVIAGFLKLSSSRLVWLLSLVFFFITIYLIRFQKDFKIKFNLINVLLEIKTTRFYLILEGFWESLIFGFIPIYTLFFLKTPVEYGLFLSYVAIISAAASLFLGHYTDKIKKRKIFIYPVTVILSITTLLFYLAVNNLIIWLIIVGITHFFVQFFWILMTAFVVDVNDNIETLMVGREICLAFGKFIGLIFVYLSFIYEQKPLILFFILSGAMLTIGIKLFRDKNFKAIKD